MVAKLTDDQVNSIRREQAKRVERAARQEGAPIPAASMDSAPPAERRELTLDELRQTAQWKYAKESGMSDERAERVIRGMM